MKKKHKDSLKTIAILFVILLLTRLIQGIPWWSFVIPVFILGVFIERKKWEVTTFAAGFLAGSVVWVASYLYFHSIFNGIILSKTNFIPLGIVLLISGIAGGLTTGLALYAGCKMLLRKNGRPVLNIQANQFIEKKQPVQVKQH